LCLLKINNNKIMGNKESWSSDFQGKDIEEAYAKVFGGKVVGGHNDGGKDIDTRDKDIPFIQAKSSEVGVEDSLGKSAIRKKFIPLVMGEPGAKKEMIESLKKYGGWVGKDEPNRQQILEKIAKIRDYCNG
jgi:hypothetical protein